MVRTHVLDAHEPLTHCTVSAGTRQAKNVGTASCDYRGWLGRGNLRANGHPSGGPWRQFRCTACKGYVLERHGTIFHGKRVSVELMVSVLQRSDQPP
jgi:hypothetical protein